MKVKVCGMKYEANIREIADLKPDFMGFIFYPQSKRYVADLSADFVKEIKGIEKTGVFVNEKAERVVEICKKYDLSYAQLHGSESPEECGQVQAAGIKVMKVFSIGKDFEFAILKPYETVADYYLFDTETEGHGGSGKKFNWSVLENYIGTKPYFLSGGIGPEDVEEILKLKDVRIHAVDINSRFELEPGRKNMDWVKAFIEKIYNSKG